MQTVSRSEAGELEPLARTEFEQIRALAHRAFGLDLKDGKRELVSARLRGLLRQRGFTCYRDYFRHVAEDRTGTALAAMIDALATNHTAFLREPDHFRFVQEKLIPRFRRGARTAVWSAACSTGEEAWTLAMVLSEGLPGRSFGIQASDVSMQALAKARAGAYPADRLAPVPPVWRQKYFESCDGSRRREFRVTAELRGRAEFRRINLIEPFHWPEPFAAIFCRNVMIYFDRLTQARVVSRLESFLEPGGHLFVGHAESLTGIEHGLEYVRPAVYRKPGRGAAG